jgi:hypothetical protein
LKNTSRQWCTLLLYVRYISSRHSVLLVIRHQRCNRPNCVVGSVHREKRASGSIAEVRGQVTVYIVSTSVTCSSLVNYFTVMFVLLKTTRNTVSQPRSLLLSPNVWKRDYSLHENHTSTLNSNHHPNMYPSHPGSGQHHPGRVQARQSCRPGSEFQCHRYEDE